MKILAVEFSSERRGVAVAENGILIGHAAETGGRATIALVERALQNAGCEREEIELLAVGLGPGSYTGIRGAIAFAQGWQLGRAVNLLGISSMDCLAAAAVREKIAGPLDIIIDAQRNEFYLARYEVNDSGARLIEPLRLAPMAEIAARKAQGVKIAGPDLGAWFPDAIPLYPDAAMLAQLAEGRSDFIPGEKLEPIYLRETAFKKAPPLRRLP